MPHRRFVAAQERCCPMLVRRTPAAQPRSIARSGREDAGRGMLRERRTTGWSAFRCPPPGYSCSDSSLTSYGVLSGCAGRRCAHQRCARRDRNGGGSRCETHAQPVRSARDRGTGPLGDRERFGSRELRAPGTRHFDRFGPGHRVSASRKPAVPGSTTRPGCSAGTRGTTGADRAQRLDRAARRIALPDARRVAGAYGRGTPTAVAHGHDTRAVPAPGNPICDTGGQLPADTSQPFQTESGGVL